jgi:hypothetical protein
MRNFIYAMKYCSVILFGLMLTGSLLYAQDPVLFINPFDSIPIIAATATPGAWYPDRFPPAVFDQYNFNGENVLHVGIRMTDSYANRPIGYRSSFTNTQGRKFDLGTGNGVNTSLVGDLYVGADWDSTHRMATIWSTAKDSAGSVSAYNIFGYRNTTGSNPGFYVYGYNNNGAYTQVPFTITYGTWYSLKIELTNTAFVYSINGTVVLSDTALNGATYFDNIMLQAYSFADSTLAADSRSFDEYDVYWDNVGATGKSFLRLNPAPVNFLTADNFSILAGSAITIGSGTTINGSIGVSPGSTVTNNGTVIGAQHLNDATAIAAKLDLVTAYNDVAGRVADTTVGSELGGTTLGRGVYVSAAGTFAITGTLTLNGTPDDVFIFLMASTLTTGTGSSVVLTGGAQASNVYWQAGSSATIGGVFNGNILALTAITQNTGSTINGKVFAQNSFVTVGGTSVTPVEQTAGELPDAFALMQNYPNPFNPSTTIRYSLANATHVSVTVYDILGNTVATLVNSHQESGSHAVQFNANDGISTLASGIYIYRIVAGSYVSTKKLTLMK